MLKFQSLIFGANPRSSLDLRKGVIKQGILQKFVSTVILREMQTKNINEIWQTRGLFGILSKRIKVQFRKEVKGQYQGHSSEC